MNMLRKHPLLVVDLLGAGLMIAYVSLFLSLTVLRSDDTAEVLDAWAGKAAAEPGLSLRWAEEPAKGKSNALNLALSMLQGDAAAFIDDDHRVDADFLVNTERGLREHPQINILCGRILPDWDGREPKWIHETGPYRLYPPPVPMFDAGDDPRDLTGDVEHATAADQHAVGVAARRRPTLGVDDREPFTHFRSAPPSMTMVCPGSSCFRMVESSRTPWICFSSIAVMMSIFFSPACSAAEPGITPSSR